MKLEESINRIRSVRNTKGILGVKVYLAHSLGLREYVAEKIEPKFISAGFTVINPFADRLEALAKYGEDEEKLRAELKELPRWIVQHDLADVAECDCVVVYNPKGSSYGSTFEAAFAWFVLGIPVFFIVNEKYINHPWLNYMSSIITLEDDIDFLIESMKGLFKYFK